MNWIKLEEQLPPKNTLVVLKRYPNKIEEEPIYYAMREDKPLTVNPDASRDCYWHGSNQNTFLAEHEKRNELDCFSSFSDVTVKVWAFIEPIK